MSIAYCGKHTESNPRYQAAVKAQQAKELARLNPQLMITSVVPIRTVDDKAERERLHLWFLTAEYNSEKPSAAAIIEMNARKHGLTVEDIKGDRRIRPIITAKDDTIEDMHRKRPDLTLPQMGKEMGKDHTTILHSLRKRGIQYKTRETLNQDTARRMYQDGMTSREIADALGFSIETIRRVTMPSANPMRRP